MLGLEYKSYSDLVKAAGNIGTTIFHPVGTCKMGSTEDESAVLTSELLVKGTQNVR